VSAILRWDLRTALSHKKSAVGPSERDRLRPPCLVAFFFSVAGLFVATQYEIPFKLSISTFHVSVMTITPAIASHKVRHPSPSNFSVFMASRQKVSCRDPERGYGG
jgi:hypothetical protein